MHYFRIFLLAAAVAWPSSVSADGLDAVEQRVVEAVDGGVVSQIDFLERIVNINSGTKNLAGVREVGRVFAAEFEALGFETEWLDMPAEMERAGHLVARRGGTGGKSLLLLGHLDTVFPTDSPFQKFVRDGDRATGPGTDDMKSGDVVILYALKALDAAGALDNMNVTVMLTGDEESVGLPLSISRGPMIELAKNHDYALSFEGGEVDTAVVGRRGSSRWELRVTGRRAHSSAVFRDEVGAGAIFEAARILNGFYEEVRAARSLTFNPGLILGGTEIDADLENSRGTAFGKSNVVAQTVIVKGGLRFITEEEKEEARAKMRAVVDRNLPQTDAEIIFEDAYPAMTPTDGNRAIFAVLTGINADLGYPVPTEYDPNNRGAGDISFVAPIIDSIDGLGTTGGNDHSVDEWMDLNSVGPMTRRAALLVYRLAGESSTAD